MRRCLSLFLVILAATEVAYSQPTIKLNDDFSDDSCTQLSMLAAEIQSMKWTLSSVDGKT